MKKKEIRKYQIFSLLFTFILGTLLHFIYEWSGDNKFVALFSATNESTWEHLKLLFFPMLISTIIGLFYFGKNAPNFLCSKTIGIVVGVIFIVVFFYTYTGILGKNIDLINILSFFIAAFFGDFTAYILMINKCKCNKIIATIVLILLLVSFIVFTYKTPHIGIFKDPITGEYGIKNN